MANKPNLLMFLKGIKKMPENDAGINLLSTTLKLTIKAITNTNK